MKVNLQEIEKESEVLVDQEIAVEVDHEAGPEIENTMHLNLKVQKVIEDQVI